MTKTKIANEIRSRIDSLTSMIANLEQRRQGCNGDHIIVNNQRGIMHFYVAFEDGKKKHVTDRATISNLATRRYNADLLDAAIKEKRQLERCIKHLMKDECNSDVERVLNHLPESLREYVSLDRVTDEGYAANWLANHNTITEKDRFHIYKTIKGDYVRSKSESIIADRLFSLGIPYAYETLRVVDDERAMIIHPDFLVLNKSKRKEYIWEHCGMMDESKYCNETLHRLKILSKHGYVQGKNLLFSYETKENPLDMGYVEKLIKTYLI